MSVFVCVCLSGYVHVRTGAQRLEEGVRSLGAGVIGGYEL